MSPERYFDFDEFRLDVARRVLTRRGVPVSLPAKTLDVLVELVRTHGEVVTKDELLSRVWPDTVVEEKNLTVAVSALRKVFGETPQDHRFIVTESGRGYRFVAEVRDEAESDRDDADTPGALDVAVETPPDRTAELVRHRSPARWLFGLAALVLVAAGVAYLTLTRGTGTADATVDTIAVLPFRPLTAAGRDEALELGMADTLITRLSHLRSVTVRPISAVRRYATVDQDALAAGRELGVDAVVEGSIQRIGDRVRVNVRLVRVADGKPLWAGKLDEAFTDIFALQDAIAERVAGAVTSELTGDERARLTERYTRNATAYEHYLRGRYLWSQRTPAALLESVASFERAIAIDPAYAPAYAGLADAYHSLVYWEEYPPREYMPRARDAAERALAIDASLAEAHTSLAIVYEDFDWRFADAEREYRAALAINPNSSFAHERYGQFLMEMARFDEARAEFDRAIAIDPVSINAHLSLASLFYFRRDYDLAIEQLRRTTELAPDYVQTYGLLGVVYREKGMDREAVDVWLRGASPEHAAALRAAFARGGMNAFLREDVARARRGLAPGAAPPIWVAMEYAYLGERDEAFALLETAYAERHSWLGELKVEPAWDNLRGDPRFDDLVRRVGL